MCQNDIPDVSKIIYNNYGSDFSRSAKPELEAIKKDKRPKHKVKAIILQTVRPHFYERLGFLTFFTFNGEENYFMSLNFDEN